MSTKFDRNQRWGIDNEVFDSKRLKRVVAVVGLPVGFDWRWLVGVILKRELALLEMEVDRE